MLKALSLVPGAHRLGRSARVESWHQVGSVGASGRTRPGEGKEGPFLGTASLGAELAWGKGRARQREGTGPTKLPRV